VNVDTRWSRRDDKTKRAEIQSNHIHVGKLR
jgi:hypothetical protein